MNITKHSFAVLTACFVTAASAQFVGPGATAPHSTIAAVLEHAVDDSRVELEGYLTKQVGREKFIFTDGRKEIRVDIDAKYMPTEKFDEKARIKIRGEVEKEFLSTPEIDVDYVAVIK